MAKLRGVLVPLVTPFDEKGDIDLAAFAELADYVLEQGASGLVLTAMTGEGSVLSAAEIETIWKAAMARHGKRVPIVPTILATSAAEAIRLGTLAAELGAAAVLVSAIMPELYGGRGEKQVIRFYESFCATVSIPVILFNHPPLAGYDLTPALIAQLAAIPNIGYVKESTGDSRRVSEIQFLCDGRIEVICGSPENALESLALGCEAWITAVTNLIPRGCRALMNAVACGDLARARAINSRVLWPAVQLIRNSNNAVGTVKAGLALRGLRVGVPRPPGLPLEVDENVRRTFQRMFDAERECLESAPKPGSPSRAGFARDGVEEGGPG